jgi:hypothetical protein
MVYPIFFPPLLLLYVSLSFVLLPLALISLFFKFRNSKLGFHGPFLYIICSDSCEVTAKAGEQAEVGQSPTLLALRFATGVLSIPKVYFAPLTIL